MAMERSWGWRYISKNFPNWKGNKKLKKKNKETIYEDSGTIIKDVTYE